MRLITPILLVVAGGLSVLALALPAPVLAAEVLSPACQAAPDSSACTDTTNLSPRNNLYGPEGLLTRAARLMAIVAGAAGVIMIVIGGFKYIVSSGDSTNINSAKNTIMFALIGLAIAATSQAIVFFVLNRL